MGVIAKADLGQSAPDQARGRGHHQFRQHPVALVPGPVFVFRLVAAVLQVRVEQAGILGQDLGESLARRRHHQHVIGARLIVLKRRQDGRLAALDHAHGHVGQAGEQAARGVPADQVRIPGDGDLADELLALPVEQAIGQA